MTLRASPGPETCEASFYVRTAGRTPCDPLPQERRATIVPVRGAPRDSRVPLTSEPKRGDHSTSLSDLGRYVSFSLKCASTLTLII